MNRQQKNASRRIVAAALMAALTTAGSALRITMPLSIAGFTSFHLGNILCALSGILLGPWLGAVAAGLGSAIYDMLNPMYISEAWITFLTKAVYGLMAGAVCRIGKREHYAKYALAALAGAVCYGVVYLSKSYFYNGMLLSGLSANAAWLNMLAKVPATVFNGTIAVIFAPILAVSIRKALEQNHLSLE